MKKRKIFVAGGNYKNYANWLENKEFVNRIEDADLLLLAGGADVHPAIYKEPVGQWVQTDMERDRNEKILFEKANAMGIPILGICRGSQFTCAASGGKVIQHQSNPLYIHPIHLINGEEIEITSTHHNAMNPYNLPKEDYEIIGWTEGISEYHLNGKNEESYLNNEKEVEICYFKKTKALGIQGHPESLFGKPEYAKTIKYLRELVDEKL